MKTEIKLREHLLQVRFTGSVTLFQWKIIMSQIEPFRSTHNIAVIE